MYTVDPALTRVQPCPGQFVRGGLRPLMAMVEVTNRCNLKCRLCFSNAAGQAADVSLDRIHRRLENLLHVTGGPIPLQFDGLEATTHIALRGRNLQHIRIQAIEAARQAGLCCTLACSITPGINDHEMGAIIDFAWAHIDTVRAVDVPDDTGPVDLLDQCLQCSYHQDRTELLPHGQRNGCPAAADFLLYARQKTHLSIRYFRLV